MLASENLQKTEAQHHRNTAQDSHELNAMLRRKIAFLFTIAMVTYPFVALLALIIIAYLAKSIDIMRLLPLILSPIGTTGGFYLIAKRMLPVDPDWLTLEREKLHRRGQIKDEDAKEESS